MRIDWDPRIITAGGGTFRYTDPESSDYSIEDIAHALSNTCRFGGHCTQFYSVAQHSVEVSKVVGECFPEHAFAGLMHDAAEAFIGDIPTPLKWLLQDFKAIEKNVESAIFARFGLPKELPACVKEADLVMLATERRDLMPKSNDVWDMLDGVVPHPSPLVALPPERAKALFLQRYGYLGGGYYP